MSKPYNKNITRVLQVSREMMVLADAGDAARKDRSCGILYGTLRDAAYKLRSLAENEKRQHQKNGIWDDDKS